MPFIPPGGFAGFAQMTPASKVSLVGTGKGAQRVGGKRKKRVSRASGRKRGGVSRRRPSSRKKGPKFGTPAFNKKHGVGQFAKKRRRAR